MPYRWLRGRSLLGALRHRHTVAALLILAVSLPVASSRPASRVGWDVGRGPSRFAAVGRIPGSPVAFRPTDGNADPQGHGYTVPSQHLCGPHLCVHWVSSTSDAPPSFDFNGNTIPDQVDATLRAFETAWRVEVVRMGFRAPKSDGTSADHGPNDELDVYLADVGALGLERVRGDGRPARRGRRVPVPRLLGVRGGRQRLLGRAARGERRPGGLRATAAHEFFHAVQFAYDSSEDAWLTEGTAVWMEDRVADDVDANRRWLRSSSLVHPWVPIDSSRRTNEYGAWIFWRFLTESDGVHGPDPTIIRRVWELAADGPGDPNLFSARAVQQALDARDRSLAGALATFGVWNLAPAAFYEEGSAYPRAPVSRQHRVNARHPIAGWSTIDLEPPGDRVGVVRPGCRNVGRDVAPAGAGRARRGAPAPPRAS